MTLHNQDTTITSNVRFLSMLGFCTLTSAQLENTTLTSFVALQQYMPESSFPTFSMTSWHDLFSGSGVRSLNQRYIGAGTPVASQSRMNFCPITAGAASGCRVKRTSSVDRGREKFDPNCHLVLHQMTRNGDPMTSYCESNLAQAHHDH